MDGTARPGRPDDGADPVAVWNSFMGGLLAGVEEARARRAASGRGTAEIRSRRADGEAPTAADLARVVGQLRATVEAGEGPAPSRQWINSDGWYPSREDRIGPIVDVRSEP